MLELLVAVWWFMLPAGLANMAASLSRFIPLLAYPVDGGLSWRGQRILGDHKTWRGIFFASLIGILVFYLQKYLYQFEIFGAISWLNYDNYHWFLGFLLGFGTALGDAIKSFFKRRIKLAPGKSWLPFDQIDWLIGALILSSPFYFPGWSAVVILVITGFGLHIFFNHLGYWLKLQKNKF